MLSRITTGVRRIIHTVLHALAGASVVGLAVAVHLHNGLPDLSVWHYAELDAEFTTRSDVADFAGYLRLEQDLFEQLDNEVHAKVEGNPDTSINRFVRNSKSDPNRWPTNWNRTFQLTPETPVASALLLHGLSDSPYSMRAVAERLYERGVAVVALRIPGHGTAPGALARARWQDMAAAVELAMRHLADTYAGKPLYLVGYSNGGALSVEYTLTAIADPELPKPDGLLLMSPEIGVSKFAVFAVWQARLGRLLGIDKLAWQSIEAEYDPYKYNSFAINAGDLAYRLTSRIQKHIEALRKSGKIDSMPPILAFQSAVDATVDIAALVENLFLKLEPPDHELVVFDVNRTAVVEHYLAKDPRTVFGPLIKKVKRGFTLTVVTNLNDPNSEVIAATQVHGDDHVSRVSLEGHWPSDVYSLSHIALPFAPDDSLYGGRPSEQSPGIYLGKQVLRGEKHTLKISGAALLRMHWNPFFDYLESRMFQFMKLCGAGTETKESNTC